MRKNQTDFNSSWQKKGLQVSRKPTGHSFKTSEKKKNFWGENESKRYAN